MLTGGDRDSRGARRAGRGLVATALAGLLGGLLVAAAEANKGTVLLASRQSASGAGSPGDDDSFGPSISANGRFIAFSSDAQNLSGADDATVRDVFVYDARRKRLTLVSRRSASAGGAGGDADSELPSISADGRYVAFSSLAQNLSPGVTAPNNVFVRDLRKRKTILVSRRSRSAGGAPANLSSGQPSISNDGRFVSFFSGATNLSPAALAFSNIYRRDLKRRKTVLVSRRSKNAGGGGQMGTSFASSISGDGRYVTFASDAPNLSGADADGVQDIFVRDIDRKRTVLASRRSGRKGAGGDDDSDRPSISDDGTRVAFKSAADNLVPANVGFATQVYVRDLARKRTSLASRRSKGAGGAPGDAPSDRLEISGDGRYVAFETAAGNLSGITQNVLNVFLRDLKRKRTLLVSRQAPADGGAAVDSTAGNPSPSRTGRFVAFHSNATNLSTLDINGTFDVFRRTMLGP